MQGAQKQPALTAPSMGRAVASILEHDTCPCEGISAPNHPTKLGEVHIVLDEVKVRALAVASSTPYRVIRFAPEMDRIDYCIENGTGKYFTIHYGASMHGAGVVCPHGKPLAVRILHSRSELLEVFEDPLNNVGHGYARKMSRKQLLEMQAEAENKAKEQGIRAVVRSEIEPQLKAQFETKLEAALAQQASRAQARLTQQCSELKAEYEARIAALNVDKQVQSRQLDTYRDLLNSSRSASSPQPSYQPPTFAARATAPPSPTYFAPTSPFASSVPMFSAFSPVDSDVDDDNGYGLYQAVAPTQAPVPKSGGQACWWVKTGANRMFLRTKLNKGKYAPVACFAMSADGVLLVAENGKHFASDVPDELFRRLRGRSPTHPKPLVACISTDGQYYMRFENGRVWCSIASAELQDLTDSHELKTVAFGPNGMWAAVSDSNEVFCASKPVMPQNLLDVLTRWVGSVEFVSIGPNAEWFVRHQSGDFRSYIGIANTTTGLAKKLVKAKKQCRNNLELHFGAPGEWVLKLA